MVVMAVRDSLDSTAAGYQVGFDFCEYVRVLAAWFRAPGPSVAAVVT
jgi:hypothetical protein